VLRTIQLKEPGRQKSQGFVGIGHEDTVKKRPHMTEQNAIVEKGRKSDIQLTSSRELWKTDGDTG
jgi:hypothetical protein